jgi:hypothetical protein
MNSVTRAAALCSALFLAATAAFAAQPADQVDKSVLANVKVSMDAGQPNFKDYGPAVGNVDTIVNFQGSFRTFGLDANGNPNSNWPWNMVGNSPAEGGTTKVDAPIIAISLRLLDAKGHQRFVNGKRLFLDGTKHARDVMNSPLFSNATFTSSSEPTQFTDAVQRAEFWSAMRQDWHTRLDGHLVRSQVIDVPLGQYEFSLNADGSCCAFVLVNDPEFSALLFPPTYPVDDTTVMGRAELSGEATTKSLTILLFQDTYLYENGDPTQCCVLGFHSFDYEPGIPANNNTQRSYVMAYASWITPGLFGGGLADITALSHELSETFNDPLVLAFSSAGGACGAVGQPICENTTPWWLSPNGNCQNSLEVGDVIENLPNGVNTVTLDGTAYHPQNVALLQWFEFTHHSNALGGAYSYPDPSVLTRPSVPQQAGCTGPLDE